MTRLEDVWAALATVRDPEVDRPITELGFVASVTEHDDGVHIQMRLPTYFCAPNFTYLMMDDARAAASRVAGAVHVELADHFESRRLGNGVGTGFAATFGAQADGELDAMRDRFRRKTFLIRQELLCRELEVADDRLPSLVVGDLPRSEANRDYLRIRDELGFSCAYSAPFLLAADGRPVLPEAVDRHRKAARVMALSYETNGAMCTALLEARYPTTEGAA
ncbi:iron-sulfur cluster assembly protein [Lentzea sp. NPDC051838]|uniref:metal-sulfur cluster assembly factor n=1 Tax=Lentzea sp. NPDC051838 TaxID=3154849 RepID=UPI00343E0EDA